MFGHNNEEATDGQICLIIEHTFTLFAVCKSQHVFHLIRMFTSILPEFPHLNVQTKTQ